MIIIMGIFYEMRYRYNIAGEVDLAIKKLNTQSVHEKFWVYIMRNHM